MKFILFLLLFLPSNLVLSQDETSVLFIGNSFTFTYDMPFKFKEIAESFGQKIYVDTVVKGGMDLKFHSKQANTFKRIRSRKWDYIVIQGYSKEFSKPTDSINVNSLPYAKKIIDSIRANSSCTKILFYETWGYKFGDESSPLIADYNSMQAVIEKEYLRSADVFSVGVIPVGAAWQKVRTQFPDYNLYNPDLYHPSKEGSYLAACTFFTGIFRMSPLNTTAKSVLPKDVRNSIELTVAQTVLGHFDQWRLTLKVGVLKLGYDVLLQNNKLEIISRGENYSTLHWDFGDGTTSTEMNPKHRYKKKGTYTIVQTLSNSCGSKRLLRTVVVKRRY